MIKTSTMFSAHAIHVLLRNTLILLVVLFIALFMWLLVGIKVDTLKVGDYSIGGLYIKLDKKLTLKSDYIMLPQSKAKPSFDNVDRVFDEVKYLFTFFESIDLKNVKFKNNQLDIIFIDNILYVTSNDYEIAGNVQRVGQILEADVSMLYLKKDDVHIKGKLTYDLRSSSLKTEGDFDGYDIKGRFFANKVGDTIDFKLLSDTFKDLHPIMNKFDLTEVVRSWVLDRVEADRYKLLSLSGKGSLERGKFSLDISGLKGEMLFSDVKIHFKEDLAPVLVPSLLLAYHNEGLYFNLKEPTYEGISLEGSEVSIRNLLNTHTNLKLKIRTDSRFDSKMQDLLKAYNLLLPLDQKSGKVNVLFMADLGLKSSYKDFFVNVDFSKGDVWLGKVQLPVEKGNVQYKKGSIHLKGIYLKDLHYEGMLNGEIDVQKKKADLVLDTKRVILGDEKEIFFVLKDQKIPFVLDYTKNINVEIPNLSLKISNGEGETTIHLNDLNKIKPYLSDTGPIENGGDIEIKTKDFETYAFKGMLKRSSCFLYEKNNKCKTRVPFQGKVTPKGLYFYAFNKRFYYNKANSRVKLSNLNFDLKKFLNVQKKDTKKEDTNKKDKSKQRTSLIILGKNSDLRYGDYSLVTEHYDVEVKPNGDIKAIGSASGDIIKFSKKNDILSIKALRIQDKALHPLINFKGLQHGRYTLKLSGNPDKTMKGEIIVEGGVMKDFKAYNNTLAFINTIPALASLQNPGYSVKGFTIEKGIAEYRMIKQDKIVFDSIYIKGTSATIAGSGEIDLKKKTIDLNLAIQSARELGKFVGSLPLVGYILMGKDKSMTFGLQITGTLDNPKVKT
ncbi:MAG: hypothetical protein HKP62_02235, partial [Sulfurovum sp.]|nr:AsmA-like C-terminal domain-containing protein [Sulfurovum sp.]NNJ44811.1 hypothetical protein [Sulfurovum sp.]